VRNRVGQVEIFAQGDPQALDAFAAALRREAPPLARIEKLVEQRTTPDPTAVTAAAAGEAQARFMIQPSARGLEPQVHLPPDLFACDDCLRELGDPHDRRRYRYPFVNCTQCGPRYTLITQLPYDRRHTTMAGFKLCPDCLREYEDPHDRRYHAEPIACRVCGPRLAYRRPGENTVLDETEAALAACVADLRAGRIVAVKGIGGYHLLCDARHTEAVARLRARKPRPAKPLAVMFPLAGADGLALLREHVRLDPTEAQALRDPSRPIVIVARSRQSDLSPLIAPGLNEIGVFLPYSPLHHLLLADFGGPLVATSANVSGEPVLTEASAVEARLAAVAEGFLHHDRPIARPADDSVSRVIAARARPLRLGRGTAPLELALPQRLAEPWLAVGGHLKNTVALGWGERAVVSPHIGDLDSPRSMAVFEQVIGDLARLYGVQPRAVVCDAHPRYASTRWALDCGWPCLKVFHHHAHAAALAGEYPDVERWLVFTWDGVGYGEDGTLWGGEALLGRPGDWRRVASWRPFRLPGGERAAREPWRSALALCWEAGWPWPGFDQDVTLLEAAWREGRNAPTTSAVGRLFDAAAALIGVCRERTSYEGEAPMRLEALAAGTVAEPLALPLLPDTHDNRAGGEVLRSDWSALLPMLCDARRTPAERAARFHASLARALLDQARALRSRYGAFTVGLAGGVFQNRLLTETALAWLREAGFEVRISERLPANDAALSFGQLVEAAASERSRAPHPLPKSY
jgi:hydrogenase maturation protein HypF